MLVKMHVSPALTEMDASLTVLRKVLVRMQGLPAPLTTPALSTVMVSTRVRMLE